MTGYRRCSGDRQAVTIAAWLANPEAQLLRLLFASLRTGAALALLPGIGAMLLPLRSRIGLSAVIGLLVLGVTPIELPGDMLSPAGLLSIAGELTIGAMAGIVLQLVFAAASVAGELLSQSMGLGFATMLDPGGVTSPVVTSFLGLLLWLVFIGLDGHLQLIAMLIDSYRTVPPGSDPLAHAGDLATFGGFALSAGLMLALPVSAVLLLVNLLLAVVSRSAPQLNIFSIGFPTLMVAGLLTLPLALPAMTGTMAHTVERGLDKLRGLYGA